MKRKSFIVFILSLVLTAAILCACTQETATKQNNQTLSVHFLDVGQGDSAFIELPNGETMLIDTGENYHGEGIIRYIERLGYSQIDYLVGTHPHSDHIGSMPYIIRHFPVRQIYMPRVSADSKLFETLLESIQNAGLTVKEGKAGVSILQDGDLSADILAPVTIDEDNLNNCSLVIRLRFGGTSFLMTGDAGPDELNAVAQDLHADVLKVMHHGSSVSATQEVLERIAPKTAVISCGADNDYGHPHRETLYYLEQLGCTVYRTDRDKTVVVTTDGTNISVKTNQDSIARATQ